ncbi:MAG: hypothetical protein IKN11_06960 [Bacteroidales bacterium]|nr:hypothetical protein [Bacteroidales bacterium]
MKKKITIAVDEAKRILKEKDVREEEAQEIMDMLTREAGDVPPWWVVVLKTLAYLIGLLLAGYGTSAAAQTLLM